MNQVDTHITTLMKCAAVCAQTTTHCLGLGEEHAEVDHITAMIDCNELCLVTANFAARQSPYTEQLMELCAEVCRSCADECERLSDGDSTMDACAKICRDCADACDEMTE